MHRSKQDLWNVQPSSQRQPNSPATSPTLQSLRRLNRRLTSSKSEDDDSQPENCVATKARQPEPVTWFSPPPDAAEASKLRRQPSLRERVARERAFRALQELARKHTASLATTTSSSRKQGRGSDDSVDSELSPPPQMVGSPPSEEDILVGDSLMEKATISQPKSLVARRGVRPQDNYLIQLSQLMDGKRPESEPASALEESAALTNSPPTPPERKRGEDEARVESPRVVTRMRRYVIFLVLAFGIAWSARKNETLVPLHLIDQDLIMKHVQLSLQDHGKRISKSASSGFLRLKHHLASATENGMIWYRETIESTTIFNASSWMEMAENYQVTVFAMTGSWRTVAVVPLDGVCPYHPFHDFVLEMCPLATPRLRSSLAHVPAIVDLSNRRKVVEEREALNSDGTVSSASSIAWKAYGLGATVAANAGMDEHKEKTASKGNVLLDACFAVDMEPSKSHPTPSSCCTSVFPDDSGGERRLPSPTVEIRPLASFALQSDDDVFLKVPLTDLFTDFMKELRKRRNRLRERRKRRRVKLVTK